MSRVFLSLGSNLGDREGFLLKAIDLIELEIGKVKKISPIYETEPWGFKTSKNFLNMVIEVETFLKPMELLDKLKKIEKILGRKKKTQQFYQSREIDIDIIFYDDLVFQTEQLTIPHKFMHKRKFVLVPMIDLDKDFLHPIFSKTMEELLEFCDDTSKIKVYNETLEIVKNS